MSRKMFKTIAWRNFALIAALSIGCQGQSQDAKATYASMAALDQYLMTDRDAEIALARSAAPESISRDAKILVLGRHGYEAAVEGKNGFVCAVERAWMSPSKSAEFWNPKIRGPVCYNPPAARSVVPILYERTEMAFAGQSKAQIVDGTRMALDKKELPSLEPGAMSYMLSRAAYLTDADDHNMAHLMFYTPQMNTASWGAGLPGSPVMFGAADPVNLFLVPVGKWSDGTAAPLE